MRDSIIMNIKDTIRLLALDLGLGQTIYETCPFCKAGHEKKFSLTRIKHGVLYNCYRASCGKSGFVPTLASSGLLERSEPTKFTPKPFTRELSQLPVVLYDWLYSEYGLLAETIQASGWKYVPDGHRLYMPVLDQFGREIGAVTKKLPVGLLKPSKPDNGPKVIFYPFTDSPRLHYPIGTPVNDGPFVVVEDVLSSTKLVQEGINAIAILGTHLSAKEAMALAYTVGKYSVRIALDPDANEKALKLHRKYALFFGDMKVVTCEVDPKDLNKEQLEEFRSRLCQ